MCDIADDDDGDDLCTEKSHCDGEHAVTYERKMSISCDDRTGEGDAGGCLRGGGDLMSSIFRITRARVVSFGLNDNVSPTDNKTTAPAGHLQQRLYGLDSPLIR